MSILFVADNRSSASVRSGTQARTPRERGAHPFAVIEKMTCEEPQGETAEADDIAHLWALI
jgi:hypothetical protein